MGLFLAFALGFIIGGFVIGIICLFVENYKDNYYKIDDYSQYYDDLRDE